VLLTLERRINEMALGDNLKGLREVLDEYQELTLSMAKEFKATEKGQGIFSFGER